MRRIDMLGITGVAMLTGGVVIFLSDGSFLPLWATWIIGPLLWYLGFAVMLVWGYQQFFGQAAQANAPEPTPALKEPVRRQRVTAPPSNPDLGVDPAGVVHEIPAMGGSIL